MICTSLTIRDSVDIYYDCVENECIKKSNGKYKNDPTCKNECVKSPNDTIIKVIIIGIGLSIILTKK